MTFLLWSASNVRYMRDREWRKIPASKKRWDPPRLIIEAKNQTDAWRIVQEAGIIKNYSLRELSKWFLISADKAKDL